MKIRNWQSIHVLAAQYISSWLKQLSENQPTHKAELKGMKIKADEEAGDDELVCWSFWNMGEYKRTLPDL